MAESPASYLRNSPSPAAYRKSLEVSGGSFTFSRDEMVELGAAYFELYPDAVQHRNNEQVLAGYEIVRITIFEKITSSFSREVKDVLWRMLKESSRVSQLTRDLVSRTSREEAREIYDNLKKNLRHLQAEIEAIPRGETRERFTGGVAVFPNTFYLFNMALEKIEAGETGHNA